MCCAYQFRDHISRMDHLLACNDINDCHIINHLPAHIINHPTAYNNLLNPGTSEHTSACHHQVLLFSVYHVCP